MKHSKLQNGLMIFAIIAFFNAFTILAANDGGSPLKVNITTLAPQVRTNSPIPLLIKFNWSGIKLLTGRLDIKIYNRSFLIEHLNSEEISITTGPQSRILNLAPVRPVDFNSMTSIKAKFICPEKTFDLGSFPISLATNETRQQTILFTAASMVDKLNARRIANQLRLELYDWDNKNIRMKKVALSTFLKQVPCDELSPNALNHCAFDQILLAEDGFASLSAKRLEAIRKWVIAGGSLCVVPGQNVLKQSHLDFINKLISVNLDTIVPLGLSKDGRLSLPSDLSKTTCLLLRPGFGRVALFHDRIPNKSDFQTPWWRETVAFLWRIRLAASERLIKTGFWNTPGNLEQLTGLVDKENNRDEYRRQTDLAIAKRNNFDYSIIKHFGKTVFPDFDKLISNMLPDKVSLIPFWLIILLLFIYFLIIGPLDYFILGKFKIRRFTWVLFPTVSILFAALIISLSNVYMTKNDHRTIVSVIDLTKNGELAKRSDFEFLFPGSSKILNKTEENNIFSPFNIKTFVDKYARINDSNVVYKGSFPGSYITSQNLKQWTPQFNRRMTFRSNNEKNKIPDFIANLDPDSESSLEKFKIELEKNNLAASLFKISAGKIQRLISTIDENTKVFPMGIVIELSSRSDRQGFLEVVSGVSPNGGASFADLSTIDYQNPKQKMLALVVNKDNHTEIYRILTSK